MRCPALGVVHRVVHGRMVQRRGDLPHFGMPRRPHLRHVLRIFPVREPGRRLSRGSRFLRCLLRHLDDGLTVVQVPDGVARGLPGSTLLRQLLSRGLLGAQLLFGCCGFLGGATEVEHLPRRVGYGMN